VYSEERKCFRVLSERSRRWEDGELKERSVLFFCNVLVKVKREREWGEEYWDWGREGGGEGR
jgi:hypothetical protein